jgi:hypothetical protein
MIPIILNINPESKEKISIVRNIFALVIISSLFEFLKLINPILNDLKTFLNPKTITLEKKEKIRI